MVPNLSMLKWSTTYPVYSVYSDCDFYEEYDEDTNNVSSITVLNKKKKWQQIKKNKYYN